MRGCGLHGGALSQLVSLRQFRLRPLATAASSVEVADHVFRVTPSDLPSKGKVRLDAYLASKLPQASRARLQASIREGLVSINGRPQLKSSYAVRPGDTVGCSVLPPPPLEAAPEPLPLDIVYEDEHLLVINKAADMVMHPSPGHYSGTLVNALLHHCGLPAMQLYTGAAAPLSLHGPLAAAAQQQGEAGEVSSVGGEDLLEGEEEGVLEESDEDASSLILTPLVPQGSGSSSLAARALVPGGAAAAVARRGGELPPTIRPGIVHRLDKGTTGLLVVAKDDPTHLSLAAQFKDRTVQRAYYSITLGVPSSREGRVAANVGRDLRDRKKMAAFAYASARGRTAASNYSVLRPLAGGAAALVQWRLETGRTHQIRVHARHLGHPLLGDETYGGGAAAATHALRRPLPPELAALGRPALHAKTLGFVHPASGGPMLFDSELPPDFLAALEALEGPHVVP